MNITHASTQSPFFLDAVWFVPLSGTSTIGGIQTVTVIPSNTAVSSGKGNSTNVGAIAGGVVGGVFGLLALALIAFFLLRRKRGQPYYFAKPTAADMLGSGKFSTEHNAFIFAYSSVSLQKHSFSPLHRLVLRHNKTCDNSLVMVNPLGTLRHPCMEAQICILAEAQVLLVLHLIRLRLCHRDHLPKVNQAACHLPARDRFLEKLH